MKSYQAISTSIDFLSSCGTCPSYIIVNLTPSWRCLYHFQAACEVFKIRDRQKIVLPKRYTSTEGWNPENYRLVNEAQPFDHIKGIFYGKCYLTLISKSFTRRSRKSNCIQGKSYPPGVQDRRDFYCCCV